MHSEITTILEDIGYLSSYNPEVSTNEQACM